MRRKRRRKHLSAALVFYSIVLEDLPLNENARLENGDVEAKKTRFFNPMSTHYTVFGGSAAQVRSFDHLFA